jgi:uncharacterized protein YbjT (DUF2867 family)
MVSVVTGAFGYIGSYIARHLLENGEQVVTITTHPDKPNPFGEAVQAFPYNFDQPEALTASLRGAATLYNTYWVRFEYGGVTFRQAVENTRTLFACARAAGVGKIVHLSVTHAEAGSHLPYYAGKGLQERALIEADLPYSIVRPTLVFGVEDILVNNIAWLMRTFPVFPIFGSGNYRLQPVYAGDVAAIAAASARQGSPLIQDAIGPEDYTFQEFVERMAAALKPGVRLAHVPPALGITLGRLIGFTLGDILLTRDELRGLMDGQLTSSQPPNGPTRFSDWLASHREQLGRRYTSELGRHFKWRPAG